MGILRGCIDHIVIASLALISSGLSRQNEILNRARLFEQAIKYKILCNDVGPTVGVRRP